MKRKIAEISTFIVTVLYSLVIVYFNHVRRLKTLHFSVKSTSAVDAIHDHIQRQYTINTNVNTKHFWNENIDPDVQRHIAAIHQEILTHLSPGMVYIPSMTELYFSSKANQNSDKQYVSKHMDGPFYACQVYRAIVAINGNKNIDTYFPADDMKVNLQKYNVVLFDYDNTPHYISTNNDSVDNSQRILVKLHFIKKGSKLCEENHCKFGRQTRDLFEANKHNLYISGAIARMGLHYNTHRKYIAVVMMSLIFIYFKTMNKYARTILWCYVLIELSILVYTLHFGIIGRQECKKSKSE